MSTLVGNTFNLNIGDLVAVQIEAYNAKGWSSASAANTAGALAQAAPTVGGTCSRGDDTEYQKIEVQWTEITDMAQNGGAQVQSYSVYWDNGLGGDISTWPTSPIASVASGSSLSVTADGLTNGPTYQFAISATNVHG
jgi:hypothetical protein